MPSTLTSFTSGDLVIDIAGNGDGSGATYTLDQASPVTLYELTTTGTIVGQLVLPQTTAVVNGTTQYAIASEYGSASEGALQLTSDGQSLVILGYGVNAAAFNTAAASQLTPYGTASLGQTSSVLGGVNTPVARVAADISYSGAVDTSTALYGIYSTNNPRSVASVDGSVFYLSGQSTKGSAGQGVFKATDGSGASVAIDTSTDTREAEIVNGVLYVSRDSSQGATNIGSYGTTLPTGAVAATPLSGITGSLVLTAAQANAVNASAVGSSINLSPQGFFFANATTLYVADSGAPKVGGIGDGGLQKWSYNGTAWVLDYTLSAGLNLVADTATTGTTGLYAITGTVVGNSVQLYVTTTGAGELDPSFLYGITDSLSATTLPGTESFTQLLQAAPDTIIRGVSFAPAATTATPTTTTIASGTTQTGLSVTSGSHLTVASGGALSGATVLSGGTAVVSGTDSGSIIARGGFETVLGAATGDTIIGTQMLSAATATATNETVNNGGVLELFLKGATATNTVISSGGSLVISGNATATNTVIDGGAVIIQSPKGVLAGSLTFQGPGLLQETAVVSAGYGDLAVISGFGAGDVIDLAAFGTGATLATAVVSGNTVATVSSGGLSEAFTFAGSVGSSLVLQADSGTGQEIAFLSPPVVNTVVASGVTSSGLTVGPGSTLVVSSGGAIVNATVQSGGLATVAGTDTGSVIAAGGTEIVLGTATNDQIHGTQIISAGTAVVNTETVFAGGVVDLYLKGGVANSLTVSSGGTLNISGNASVHNAVLTGGGVIALQSPKANLTGSLTFQGAGSVVETAVVSAGFGDLAVISGFGAGDTIDLAAIGATGATLHSAVVSGNTVETVTSGTISEAFTFAGTYVADYFKLTPDEGTGVQITATGTPCYCPGTLILTEEGEVPVERLAIGDRVMTVGGASRPVRWIGRRAYAGRFAAGQKQILPVRIAARALAEGLPRRDLTVSPLHAMFIDGLLIPASALVNGTSVVQLQAVDQVEYIHVELDTHDVIFAEGAASETFVDDHSRLMFHNAAEYRALYPDAVPVAPQYCAPRLEDGERLEAIRRRIAARAAPVVQPGPLVGCLDLATHGRIAGWARDHGTPGEPVQLQVVANGRVLCEVVADQFRPDLAAAGIGTGRHAFDIVVPGGLPADERHMIRVQRLADGAVLAERLCA